MFEQRDALVEALDQLLKGFRAEQVAAGKELSAPDALDALAHLCGALLATAPDGQFDSAMQWFSARLIDSYHQHAALFDERERQEKLDA